MRAWSAGLLKSTHIIPDSKVRHEHVRHHHARVVRHVNSRSRVGGVPDGNGLRFCGSTKAQRVRHHTGLAAHRSGPRVVPRTWHGHQRRELHCVPVHSTQLVRHRVWDVDVGRVKRGKLRFGRVGRQVTLGRRRVGVHRHAPCLPCMALAHDHGVARVQPALKQCGGVHPCPAECRPRLQPQPHRVGAPVGEVVRTHGAARDRLHAVRTKQLTTAWEHRVSALALAPASACERAVGRRWSLTLS